MRNFTRKLLALFALGVAVYLLTAGKRNYEILAPALTSSDSDAKNLADLKLDKQAAANTKYCDFNTRNYLNGSWVPRWGTVAEELCSHTDMKNCNIKATHSKSCADNGQVLKNHTDLLTLVGAEEGTPPDMVHLAAAGMRIPCDLGHRNCAEKSLQEMNRVIESLRWKWVPDSCSLHEASISGWEDVFRDRRMYVAGDSLQEDLWMNLGCLMPKELVDQHKAVMLRNDYLAFGEKVESTAGIKNLDVTAVAEGFKKMIKGHWDFQKKLPPPDDRSILVFNAGAHWTLAPKEAYDLMYVFAQAVKLTFKGVIIFRTTVMGHHCCQHFQGPITDQELAMSKENAEYNWNDFTEYNAAVTKAFRDAEVPRFYVLDISMFERRADGHPAPDCLHYCNPGPQREWLRLLYSLLVDALEIA